MAWNPSPKIADLRDIARKWGVQQVIVIAIKTEAGTYEVNSYGETRKLCNEAGTISLKIDNMLSNGTL